MTVEVYILYSSTLAKYYCGISDDVQNRIQQHNNGKGKYTSKGIPWVLVTTIACATRSEAVILENQIKKRGIKRYLQDNNII